MQSPTSMQDFITIMRLRFVPFMAVFFVSVFFTYLVLYIVDFYPEPVEASDEEVPTSLMGAVEPVSVIEAPVEPEEEVKPLTAVMSPEAALPISISFDELDKTVTVLNPTSNDIAVLDEALLSGVVRHPQSADFSTPGNIFILGHSSYLPNVLNRNFQAFNGIQDLKWGDTVRLQSSEAEYVYRVDRVYKASATEVVVPTDITEAKLTLATCNSFGSIDDRYILEATLVSTVALAG